MKHHLPNCIYNNWTMEMDFIYAFFIPSFIIHRFQIQIQSKYNLNISEPMVSITSRHGTISNCWSIIFLHSAPGSFPPVHTIKSAHHYCERQISYLIFPDAKKIVNIPYVYDMYELEFPYKCGTCAFTYQYLFKQVMGQIRISWSKVRRKYDRL